VHTKEPVDRRHNCAGQSSVKRRQRIVGVVQAVAGVSCGGNGGVWKLETPPLFCGSRIFLNTYPPGFLDEGNTMSNRRFGMYEIRRIIAQLRRDQSDRDIAGTQSVGRRTVARVRANAQAQGWLEVANTCGPISLSQIRSTHLRILQ
jgi:hypothetical protein